MPAFCGQLFLCEAMGQKQQIHSAAFILQAGDLPMGSRLYLCFPGSLVLVREGEYVLYPQLFLSLLQGEAADLVIEGAVQPLGVEEQLPAIRAHPRLQGMDFFFFFGECQIGFQGQNIPLINADAIGLCRGTIPAGGNGAEEVQLTGICIGFNEVSKGEGNAMGILFPIHGDIR